jgi:large subunit ribosomal protein L14
MIQQQTLLKIMDNSGAVLVKCIKVLNGFKKRYGCVGDYVTVSVKLLKSRSKKTCKIKKKEVYKALIIKTKTKIWKKTGHAKVFTDNIAILLNKQNNPIATRILTCVPIDLKKKKLQKIITLSIGLV